MWKARFDSQHWRNKNRNKIENHLEQGEFSGQSRGFQEEGGADGNNTDHQGPAHFSSSDSFHTMEPSGLCLPHSWVYQSAPNSLPTTAPLSRWPEEFQLPRHWHSSQVSWSVLSSLVSLDQELEPPLKPQFSSFAILVFALFDHRALLPDGCLPCPLCHVSLRGVTHPFPLLWFCATPEGEMYWALPLYPMFL